MDSLVQFCMRNGCVMFTDICRATGDYIIQVNVPIANLVDRTHVKFEDFGAIQDIEAQIIKKLTKAIETKGNGVI